MNSLESLVSKAQQGALKKLLHTELTTHLKEAVKKEADSAARAWVKENVKGLRKELKKCFAEELKRQLPKIVKAAIDNTYIGVDW